MQTALRELEDNEALGTAGVLATRVDLAGAAFNATMPQRAPKLSTGGSAGAACGDEAEDVASGLRAVLNFSKFCAKTQPTSPDD